jgi:hypothetical protein
MKFIIPIHVIHRTPGNTSKLLWEASDYCNSLLDEYNFPSTSLVGCWAMQDSSRVEKISSWKDIGLWLMPEVELLQEAGVEARRKGRIELWDKGLLAYPEDERDILARTALEKFKSCFGRYPEVAGSFHLSPDIINLLESYGVSLAVSFCWEQRFGGLVNVGCPLFPYYPSVGNSLCPGEKRKIVAFPYLSRDPLWGYLLDPVSFSPAVEDLYERRPSHRDPLATPSDLGYPSALFQEYMNQVNHNSYAFFSLANETQFFDMGYKQDAGILRKMYRNQIGFLSSSDARFSSLTEFSRWFHSNVDEFSYLLVFNDLLGEEGKIAWHFSRNYRILIHLTTLSIWDLRNYSQSFSYSPVYPAVLDYREGRYLLSRNNYQVKEVVKHEVFLDRGKISFHPSCVDIEMDDLRLEPVGCGLEREKEKIKIDAGLTKVEIEGKIKDGKIVGSFRIMF